LPESFAAVTPQGASIVELYWLAMVPSLLIFLIVVGGIAVVLIRDRARPRLPTAGPEPEPEPEPEQHGRALEITWTAIPLLLVIVLFGLGLRTMAVVNAEPENALRVQVIGHQWWWEFRYPDLGIVTANELHMPVGVPVRLELSTDDVIHTFWVPRFGGKKDSIPGYVNVVAVRVDQPGVFDGACSEYCGTQHAWMRIMVVAHADGQFDAWARTQQAPPPAPVDALARRGQELFANSTCVNCHTVAGLTATTRVGPDLSHVGSRATIGAGVVLRAPDTLEQWIRDPQAIKPGVLMPGYANLGQGDLAALAAYLDSLK
jgi:cytochrome c oxidase subunit 2